MASDVTNGGAHDEVKTVTIRIFGSHETTELAASNLEAHGIECWVNADDCGGMYPNLTAAGGVRLVVRVSDAEAAIVLLNAPASPAEINQIENDAVIPAPAETVPPKKLARGQIFVGIVGGVLLCLLYQWANKIGTRTYYHYTNATRDEAWVYRDGHLAERFQDRNLDGAWDQWAYYEHGSVARVESDNNFDGKPDETWTYSNGDLVSLEKDTDFNGVADEFYTYEYHVPKQLDMKPNGSKFTTLREVFQNGVLTEIWRGGDSNGNFKEVVRYDPFFDPIGTNNPAAFKLLPPSFKWR